MAIAVERALAPDLLDPAWALYTQAFDELRTAAVQRHMMHRHEFDEVMADNLVWKYRGIDPDDPGAVLALATFTNALDTMPLISPEYFAHRWPTLYSGRKIWYIGFFAIDPRHRGSGFFEEVIAHMWRIVLDGQGIAVLDICRRNAELGLPAAIHATLDSLTVGAQATAIDEQTYWLYEPPARS